MHIVLTYCTMYKCVSNAFHPLTTCGDVHCFKTLTDYRRLLQAFGKNNQTQFKICRYDRKSNECLHGFVLIFVSKDCNLSNLIIQRDVRDDSVRRMVSIGIMIIKVSFKIYLFCWNKIYTDLKIFILYYINNELNLEVYFKVQYRLC